MSDDPKVKKLKERREKSLQGGGPERVEVQQAGYESLEESWE